MSDMLLTPPLMPAGFNSWEISGDEFNGGGVNEPVWPDLFDSDQVPGSFIVLTDEMMAIYDEGTPDITIPYENNTIVLSRETRDLFVRKT